MTTYNTIYIHKYGNINSNAIFVDLIDISHQIDASSINDSVIFVDLIDIYP